MTTTIRLRGPADIITVLPYHLGYRPKDSLVLVSLAGGRLGFVARMDLPPPQVDPYDVAKELAPLVAREAPEEVVLLTYESVLDQGRATSVAVRDALQDAGVKVADRFVVREGRFYATDCIGSCCPPEGEELPEDADVPAVAQFVLLGRRPAVDRDELADRLRSQADVNDDESCAAVLHALVRRRGRRPPAARGFGQRATARIVEAWGQVLTPAPLPGEERFGQSVPQQAFAWAAVGLLDVHVRDLVAARLCPGSLTLDAFAPHLRRLAVQHIPTLTDAVPVETSDQVLDRLSELCRRTPEPVNVGPLTVMAQVSWWLGDGALARTALDLALAIDPDYRLALLLGQLVDNAVRPDRAPDPQWSWQSKRRGERRPGDRMLGGRHEGGDDTVMRRPA